MYGISRFVFGDRQYFNGHLATANGQIYFGFANGLAQHAI